MWVTHPNQSAPMLVDDATLPYWRERGYVEWEPDDAGGGWLTIEDVVNAPAVRAAYGAGGLDVTNLAGLTRWAAARGDVLVDPPVITVLGDSIPWGVGSDGTAGETFPYNAAQQAIYRTRAWPVQLRRMLNARYGLLDAEGWAGAHPGWNYGVVNVGASQSSSLGPFGQHATSPAGGLSIGTGDTVTYPAAGGLGKFTEIDVYYWGSDSGVSSNGVPTVTIDGTARSVPTVTTGVLNRATVTGLADTTHDVVIGPPADTTKTAYVPAVNVRRGGVTVNRIARPGATAVDIAGSSTAATRTRMLTSAVLPGTTDLLILSLGTNDQGGQVPLSTYSAALQEVIDVQVGGGGCVLLLGEPPAANPTGTLTEQQYRDAMRALALSNAHVAYTDTRDLFGTSAQGYSLGLFPTNTTVHPSARGAGVIANAVAGLLTLPVYA